MAIAVTIDQAREALSRLDPKDRALLHLSVGRGFHDDEIAGFLEIESSDVQRRVDGLLERLADDLSLADRPAREELAATLPDLPPDVWGEAPHP